MEIANFFWHGNLTFYEYKCIESFIKNNFVVNVWSYADLSLPPGANLCDAREILPQDHLTKYKQQHFLNVHTSDATEYASLAAFSDAFRYTLLARRAGWWFDCDVFCLKDQTEFTRLKQNKTIVAAGQRELNFNKFDCGCAVLYVKDFEIGKLCYDELQTRCISNNYSFSDWAYIGPGLLESIIKKYNLVNELNPQEFFYPITWEEMQLLIDADQIDKARDRTKDAYCLHLWNSQLSQVYNLKNSPPSDNFLAELFNWSDHGSC